MENHFLNHELIVALNQLAVDWANEAEYSRRGNPHAQAHERAFWFGMNYAYADSTGELLKLLRNPTIPATIALMQLLDRRRAQVQGRRSFQTRMLHIKAQTHGAGEAYRLCAAGLM